MILCLESSATPTVIGLVREGVQLAERVLIERDRLPAETESLLREANVSPRDLTAIAVGGGPGSFTGLRVSFAFAKGLARGLSIPIWPVPSLKIIAANLAGADHPIAVISPARRGEAHFALFDPLLLDVVDGPAVIPYDDLPVRLSKSTRLLGPGVAKLSEELRSQLREFIPEDVELHRPHVLHLARLAEQMWEGRPSPDIASLVPEYGLDFPA